MEQEFAKTCCLSVGKDVEMTRFGIKVVGGVEMKFYIAILISLSDLYSGS